MSLNTAKLRLFLVQYKIIDLITIFILRIKNSVMQNKIYHYKFYLIVLNNYLCLII